MECPNDIDRPSSQVASRLETRRYVRRVPHRGVIHAQIVPNAPHHDETGVEALPHLEADPLAAPKFLLIPLQGCPNPQRRMDCALRVVLVGNRRPEEGHDPIAEELVHRALVAVNFGQHHLKGAIHQAMDFFRVEPFRERGEARDIHEENRHLLALPF
jgi:hypothetical protein